MAHNPVGICTKVTTGTSNVNSTVFSHQSDSLRVTALTKGAHIGIGTSGVTATPANYFVAENTTEVINIGKPRSQRVVGVTSAAATTTLTLPEGEGSQFVVGDSVAFSVGGNSDYDFTDYIVMSVTNVNPTAGVNNQTIVINYPSASPYPDTTRDGLPYDAYVRSTFTVGTLALASGTAYLQQVQVSGDS
mgnify:FL=1|jgi:hypothetical protein